MVRQVCGRAGRCVGGKVCVREEKWAVVRKVTMKDFFLVCVEECVGGRTSGFESGKVRVEESGDMWKESQMWMIAWEGCGGVVL